ncbi:phospholipase, partial [Xanthomonas citri pv. citri]|nr:phospholipase [Xanthomonas citri pv. citri]
QSGRDTRTLIAQDLEMGRVVAIDESFRDWSSVTEIFYINAKGQLQAASLVGLGWYPVSTIVDRYETMVRTYGSRPAPTVLPKQVVKSKTAQVPDEPTPGKD